MTILSKIGVGVGIIAVASLGIQAVQSVPTEKKGEKEQQV